jgi:hypothetical protein
MLQKEGLYLFTGPNVSFPSPSSNSLAVIVEDSGKTIWLRNFVSPEYALNVLDEDVLEDFDRDVIESELKRNGAYFAEIERREGGYKDHAFQRYVLDLTAK